MTSGTRPIRVVSGMRPTGKLHLGHFHGVLRNWIKLQKDYECFFFIADLHALTTEYENPENIRAWSRDILLDWLSAGLDPERTVLFVQSEIPEHSELHLLLSMMTPLGWLERVPSYKEMQQELATKDLSTYGFLGYPLLQTADIVLYDGQKVPVGQDQVPHIELSREIVRRFNHLYKKGTLTEPQPLLTETPKLLGPDRRKMSKSYDNCLYLTDSPKEIEKKIMSSITDPARMRRDDPGNPDICLVFDYHKLHSLPDEVATVSEKCRNATLGCVDDKRRVAETVNAFLDPIRKKRTEFEADPVRVDEILRKGRARASEIARSTMERVRKAMRF